MKIAIPTNDRETIAKRTGRAEEFAIYQIENNQIQEVAYIKNTHSHDHDEESHDDGHGKGQGGGGHRHNQHHNHDHNHDHDHDHEHGEHNHDELLLVLKDIDVLLVRAVGKYMRKTLKKGNVNYKLVKIDTISEILENYLKSLS